MLIFETRFGRRAFVLCSLALAMLVVTGCPSDENGDTDGSADAGPDGSHPDGDIECVPETCNGIDDDCDGLTDEGASGCGENEECRDGSCVCALTWCGFDCVDVRSDPQNCGACGIVCPEGGECLRGECACPEGTTTCEDACVDTRIDIENCGECGNACSISCIEGECLRIVDAGVGHDHICALRSDGRVACSGNGRLGQLGNGALAESHVPVLASPMRHALQLTANDGQTCALWRDATVRCWGGNSRGALGDGTTFDRDRPSPVVGLADVLQVATGMAHTCAVLRDGRVFCWGFNDSGQLGLGTWDGVEDHRATATQVPDITNAAQVSAGRQHSCALLEDGTVQCWGSNNDGEAGFGDEEWRSSPAPVIGVADATQIALGGVHSCALITGGTVTCWGNNELGQIGTGEVGGESAPESVSELTGVTQISLGQHHSCALLEDGTISCWGSNSRGQIGDGTTENRPLPTAVVSVDDVVEVIAGGMSTCATRSDGELLCWGENSNGQLGDDTVENTRTTPTAPSWPTEPARDQYPRFPVLVSASNAIYGYGVAIQDDGSVLVTGAFAGEAVFGEGETNETTLSSVGTYDVFIAKYNVDGSLDWARSAGSTEGHGANGDHGRAVTTLPDGSLFVTGNVYGGAVFGSGEPNETHLDTGGAFLARYDPDGTLAWVEGIIGHTDTTGGGIWANPDDGVFVAGTFIYSATFADGEPEEVEIESTTGFSGSDTYDGFLARYEHDGTFTWARQVAGSGAERILELDGGGHGEALALTGAYDCEAIFGVDPDTVTVAQEACGGGYDSGFIASYSTDGVLVWATAAGPHYRDIGLGVRFAPYWMPDGDQRVLVAGQRTGYLSTFSRAGEHRWTVQPSCEEDLLNVRVAALADGTAQMIGNLSGDAIFGGDELNETSLSASLFVAHFGVGGALFDAFALASRGADLQRVASRSSADSETWITCAVGRASGSVTFFPGSAREITREGSSDSMFLVCF